MRASAVAQLEAGRGSTRDALDAESELAHMERAALAPALGEPRASRPGRPRWRRGCTGAWPRPSGKATRRPPSWAETICHGGTWRSEGLTMNVTPLESTVLVTVENEERTPC